MANIKVVSKTQKIIVNSTTSSITVISKLEQPIVITQAFSSVSVINTGPMGPRGLTGPADAANVLTVDGQIMTRAFGGLAPITRTDLAADPAFTAYLTAHVAHANPHPDYMTTAEDAAIMSAHVAAANPHPDYMTTAEDAAIMSAHVAAANPHPDYMTTAEDAAIMSAHVAAADPHSVYLTQAEGDGRYARFSGSTFNTTASASISWTGGGAFQVFQPNAGYDSYIDFHVGSDYAIEFGLAGDINDLAVGGWSMGANKYRIYHAGNESVWASATSSANKVVKYSSAGYIQGTYINMTADVGGGWPAYIAGQNGDNYMRWYNKNGNLVFTGSMGLSSGYGIYFNGIADTNHVIAYDSTANGPSIWGYGSIKMYSVGTGRSWQFYSDGNAYASGGGLWVTSSLEIKKNIVPLTTDEVFEIARKFQPVWFDFKDDRFDTRSVGTIAEWTAEFLPEVVKISPGGDLSMDYGPLASVALGAVGKLLDRVEKLEETVYKMKGNK